MNRKKGKRRRNKKRRGEMEEWKEEVMGRGEREKEKEENRKYEEN